MNIAILGTRGIPNMYGGFEEFAEYLSYFLAERGHTVFVFCHYSDKVSILSTKNIHQIFIKRPDFIGGEFIYDYRCVRRSISLSPDIILQCGYVTSIIPTIFFYGRNNLRVVFNLDGLEWKRSKFNFVTRRLIKVLEQLTVRSYENLIADNKGILKYILSEYGRATKLIEYGTYFPNGDPICRPKLFVDVPEIFDLVVARFEPENSLEEILEVYLTGENGVPLVIVANKTPFYYKIFEKFFSSKFIYFLGPIYSNELLDYLRYKCRFYIHGHQVGGTNPSLLSAMACGCTILALDNIFNRDVLGDFGSFWENEGELSELLKRGTLESEEVKKSQIEYTKSRYSWEVICNSYLIYFRNLLRE